MGQEATRSRFVQLSIHLLPTSQAPSEKCEPRPTFSLAEILSLSSSVGQHEAAHVSFLQNALGSSAAHQCNYTFPHTSAESFLSLAAILESVGVSAYLGVAGVGLTETSYIVSSLASFLLLSLLTRHSTFPRAFAPVRARRSSSSDSALMISSFMLLLDGSDCCIFDTHDRISTSSMGCVGGFEGFRMVFV